MAIIETRVLEMRFDNASFERNMNQSISTLDKLKGLLNFKSGQKSLEDLGNASDKFHMNGVTRAVESVTIKFDAMGLLAMNVLTNITNKAVAMGEQLIKSFTIDPIKTGLQEYETQINAVQTILANTQKEGTTIADVNAALDELNHYADLTIYNFTEMTRNIGTFTAAGVKLDDSVAAIKGIANLAAVSGSTSEQASRAMYQLSQAMASGTVKLQDWNSVVNAGMGGQVFQDSLMETARVHGIAIDKMVEDAGSFRETLQKGWLTTDVLTETLQKFTGDLSRIDLLAMGYNEKQIEGILKMGVTANEAATKVKTFTQLMDTLSEAAQSGWSAAWRIIIGDFEEAKAVWTTASDEISAIINNMNDNRVDMLLDWKKRGGRDMGLMAIRNIFDSLVTIVSSLRTGFQRVFEPLTGEKLYKITLHLTNLTEKFKANEHTAYNLRHIARGLASAFDLLLKPIKLVVDVMVDLIDKALPAGDGIMSMAANLGDFIYEIDKAVEKSGFFEAALNAIKTVLSPLETLVKNVTKLIKSLFDEFIEFDLTIFDTLTNKITETDDSIEGFFNTLKDKVTPVSEFIRDRVDDIGVAFDIVKEKVVGILEQINLGNLVGAFTIVGVGKLMNEAFDVVDKVMGFFKENDPRGFLDKFKSILGGVEDSLKSFQDNLRSETLKKIAQAIAILSASLFLISLIPTEKLMGAITGITTMVADLMGAMLIFEKFLTAKGLKGIGSMTIAFIGISTALVIMSGALVNLGQLKWDEIARGLAGVAGSMTILIAAVKVMPHRILILTAAATTTFAEALVIMADAVKKIGELPTDQMVQGLEGIAVLLAEIVVFLNILRGNMAVRTATSLVILSVGLNVMAVAVEKLGKLQWDEVSIGLKALGGMLAELAVFVIATKNASGVITTAMGLTILSGAIIVLSEGLKRLGEIPWDNIKSGLIAMGGALTIMTIAMKGLPAEAVMGKSVSYAILSGTMILLAESLSRFAELNYEEIERAATAMAAALTIMTLAMQKAVGGIPGAAAILIMTGALFALLPIIKGYSEFGLVEFAIGLGSIAATIGLFAAAGMLLGPVVPIMASVAGTLVLFGIAVAGVGVGIFLLSAGLASLALAVTTHGLSISAVMAGLSVAIPEIFTMLGNAFTSFIEALGNNAETIATAMLQIGRAAIQVLDELIPDLVEAILTFVETMLNTLADHAPDLIEAGGNFLHQLLQGLVDALGPSIASAIETFGEFIEGIIKGIGEMLGKIKEVGSNIFSAIKDGMFSKKKDVVDTTSETIEASKGVIVEQGVPFENLGMDTIENFVKGLKKKEKEPIDTLNDMLVKAIGDMKKKYEDWVEVGKHLMNGLKKGINDSKSDVITAAVNVAVAAYEASKRALDIESPSKKMISVGRYFVEGFAVGLEQYGEIAEEASSETAKEALRRFSEAISDAGGDFGGSLQLNPTITPVLDLSNIEEESGRLDALLRPEKINLAAERGMVDSITRAMGMADAERTDVKTKESGATTEVNFVQNNYSPKALSRIEIYRQTKNQISSLKGLMV